MKRATIVISAAVMAAGFTSCGKSEAKPQELEKNFTCDAVIVQDETEYCAELERIDGAGWHAVFTAPETIEGLEVSLLNDKCTVSFGELTYTSDREELPQYGMLELVTCAADSCILGKAQTTRPQGEKFIQTGRVRDCAYSAEISGKRLESIEISDDITVLFSNYSDK